ncbi:MAG TPA: tRNA-dihydrouridine synthase family protein, partial [bacterium]|nr:tRNA-dihydrouridine synthase family protein [bacterium]
MGVFINITMNFWEDLKQKNKPILALAPLAGITDSAQRQLCKYFGADVLYTEMVSSDGLFYNSKTTLAMLKIESSEHPVILQLFGKDPEKYKIASKIVEEHGFDGIDINFGCPAKKVVAHSGGVSLMKDLDKCKTIIEAVLNSTSLPVSIKIRAGINNITAIDLIEKIKDLPISAIMIHG